MEASIGRWECNTETPAESGVTAANCFVHKIYWRKTKRAFTHNFVNVLLNQLIVPILTNMSQGVITKA